MTFLSIWNFKRKFVATVSGGNKGGQKDPLMIVLDPLFAHLEKRLAAKNIK